MSSKKDKKEKDNKDKKSESEVLMSQGPSPHTLRKLSHYALGTWAQLLGLAFCVVVGSLLDLAMPWILGFMLLDGVIMKHDPGRLPFVVFLMASVFVGQQIVDFGKSVLQESANQRMVNRIRCDLYEHTIALPVRFFDRGRTGDLLSRFTGDIDTLSDFLDTLTQDIVSQVVMLVATLGLLFKISPKLTLFLLPTVVALASSVIFFRNPVKRFSRRVRNLIGDISSMAEEAIGGIRVVKAFCAERFELGRLSAKSSELLRGRVKAKTLSSIYSSSVALCIFTGTMIVVVMATPWVLGGALQVGALVAYLSYLDKLYGPVKTLSKINLSVQKIMAAGDRVFELMSVAPEPVDGFMGDRKPLVAPSAKVQFPARLSGAVLFDKVNFSYDAGSPVLKNFSLSIKPGEVVALVGPSGGGKTTIVNLLLRFYEPTSGRILIDGVPIDRFPLSKLRQQIGVVSQETYLFSGSGRENIAYAMPHATEEQVTEAARAAHAHEFLSEAPDGYDSEVGERGVQLSGGQRQRLAIARALLRNPRIMIFDEATSHLDSESEMIIQEALEKLAKGRTVFIVAHRLSSIRRADKIVVIEDGEMVEIGKHEELLAREGIYHKLYTLQVSYPGESAN